MLKKILLSCASALFCVFVWGASAQAAETGVLSVSVDKGVSVSLGTPAASVFIANPDVADIQVLSPQSVMVFGRKTGQTTLLASDENGKEIIHKTVIVAQDLTDLRLALKTVIPDNKISAEAVPDGIVLSGETNDPSVIEDARRLALRYVTKEGEIINRIKVKGSNQILLRVRFAEVSRDVDKRFGINWENIGSIGGMTFGFASGNDVYSTTTAGVREFIRPTVGGTSSNVIGVASNSGNWDINSTIDALAEEGFITILAEPNLTAMSGETASFLAGGEFPIPVPQGADTISITFKSYGISLAFTPTLIGKDRINLHVKPEVSQLSSTGAVEISGVSVSAITTRRAETTIELGSGQSFAIAGLLNSSQQQTLDKYPFLGDVPVLGALFRSSRFQNNQSELVIIITPYIVKPVSEDQISLPTDKYRAPSDADLILRQRTSASDESGTMLSGKKTAVPALLPEDGPTPSSAPLMPVTQSVVSTPIPVPVAPRTVEAVKPVIAVSPPAAQPVVDQPAVKEDPVVKELAPVSKSAPALTRKKFVPVGPSGYIVE